MSGQARVDVWLWAVRVFKTRSAANSACAAGAVRVDGVVAKPSRPVRPGMTVAPKQAQPMADSQPMQET